jgi:type VI secretion system protein ImpC
VNVGAAFFGKENALEAARIPLLRSHLESAEFVKWAAFRQSEASRWVGVCFNRFLLRGQYADGSSGKLPFPFREQRDGLLGNPAWAIGSLLTRSFAQSGWCGHITGIRAGGAIDDLPVHTCRLSSGAETQIPLETIFVKDREDDFFVAGFMVLQSSENQDKAVLLRAPSAHYPEMYSDTRDTETSRWRSMLTYQLVAARLIHYLSPMLHKLLPRGSPSEIEQGVKQGLRSLLAQSGAAETAGVQVSLRESEGRSGFYELGMNIRPGPSIWSLPIDLELQMNLRA